MRDFLGLCLIYCFEQRRAAVQAGLQARRQALTDLDAELQLWSGEQATLLEWLDALWSSFLQVRL